MPLLCRIEPISKVQKFQNSLAVPFEQVLTEEVISDLAPFSIVPADRLENDFKSMLHGDAPIDFNLM